VPAAPAEIEYAAITRAHEASRLVSCEPPWRFGVAGRGLPFDGLEAVIERRGSARRFRRDPIARADLERILALAAETELNEVRVVANAVEGLDPGAYRVDAGRGVLEPVRLGDVRSEAGAAALDQALAADAAADVVFVCDLERVLGLLGERGYRAAQLEAGVRGGDVYLAAYALGLRASGLTFYDDEAAALVGAPGAAVTFVVAVGR